MATTVTPNIGLKKPEFKDKRWDDEIRDNSDILDAVIGKLTDVGNYDSGSRPSISKIVGEEPGLSKSLIQAILDNENQIVTNSADIAILQSSVTPAGLNNFDSNPTYKLGSAPTFADAINWLDGVFYEVLNPADSGVSGTAPYDLLLPGPDLIELASTAGVGTPVGPGIIRWHKDRQSLGIQFFGQPAEGDEVYVDNDIPYILTGNSGIGSLTVTVKSIAGLIALPADEDQTFALSSNAVDLTDNVLSCNGEPCCAIYDPVQDKWHFAFTDSNYNFPKLTVTNGGGVSGGARVETNYGTGFSNGVQVYYVSIKGQDTTAESFMGYFKSVLAQWALFQVNTLSASVFTGDFSSIQQAIETIDTVGVNGGPWTLGRDQLVSGTITLNFGAANARWLRWSDPDIEFQFNGPLDVDGLISGDALTVDNDITSISGGLSVASDITSSGGDLTVFGDIKSTDGDLDILTGDGHIGGDLTVDGDINILTPGAVINTDANAVDLDRIIDALNSDYVEKYDTTPPMGKIGTRREEWWIGDGTWRTNDLELVAGVDWNYFNGLGYSIFGQPKIRFNVGNAGGPPPPPHLLRWEVTHDGINWFVIGGGGGGGFLNPAITDLNMNGWNILNNNDIETVSINKPPASPVTEAYIENLYVRNIFNLSPLTITASDGLIVNTGASLTTFQQSVVIQGDLEVQGTTTTINTDILDVEDQNITVNAGGSTGSADGAGLTVFRGAGNAAAQLNWNESLLRWEFGYPSAPTGGSTLIKRALNSDDLLNVMLLNGSQAMTGNLNMGTNNITNVGTINSLTVPAGPGTFATVANLSSYLPLAGGTMTGTLNMGTNAISNITTLNGNSIATGAGAVVISTNNASVLADISYPAAPVTGQALIWNGSNWIPQSASALGQTLGQHADVSIAGTVNGDMLYFNGTNWVRTTNLVKIDTGAQKVIFSSVGTPYVLSTFGNIDMNQKNIVNLVAVQNGTDNITRKNDYVGTLGFNVWSASTALEAHNGTNPRALLLSGTIGGANVGGLRLYKNALGGTSVGKFEYDSVTNVVAAQVGDSGSNGTFSVYSGGTSKFAVDGTGVIQVRSTVDFTGADQIKIWRNANDLMFRDNTVAVNVSLNDLLTGSGISPQPFDWLSNVSVAAAATGDIVYYNGANWVNSPIIKLDTSLGSENVEIGSTGTPYDLKLHGALMLPDATTKIELDGTDLRFTDSTGTYTLDELATISDSYFNDLMDVVITGSAPGHTVYFDGANWINTDSFTIGVADITVGKALSPRNLVVNGPVFLPDATTQLYKGGLNDLTFVDANTNGGSPVTLNDLYTGAGIPASALTDLTDVTITGPVTQYSIIHHDGANWVNTNAVLVNTVAPSVTLGSGFALNMNGAIQFPNSATTISLSGANLAFKDANTNGGVAVTLNQLYTGAGVDLTPYFKHNGTVLMSGNLQLNNNNMTGIGTLDFNLASPGTAYIKRTSNDLIFRDVNVGAEVTLTQLLKGTKVSNPAVGIGSTVVDSFANTLADGVVWKYVAKNTGTNSIEAGTITACWINGTVSVAFASTASIGTTTGINFTVTDVGPGTITLTAVVTSGTWNVKLDRGTI